MSEAIERLDFDAESVVSAAEAAIHLNRYLIAKPFCAGKRVLDISCGEGYGTHFLASVCDARHVDGVDISEQAVAKARKHFSHERVQYHVHAGEELGTLFEADTFDVVVSLETFEHLTDPLLVLKRLKQVLKPDGVMIVSCPNDHMYYLTPEEGNPFHIRKYSFEEFRSATEGLLGPARAFHAGVPLNGYMNVAIDARLAEGPDATAKARFEPRQLMEAMSVLPQELVNWETCNYYLGIWGPEALSLSASSVVYASTMQANAPAAESLAIQNMRDEIVALRTQIWESDGLLQSAAQKLRHSGLRSEAFRAENELLREELSSALKLAEQRLSESQTHARQLAEAHEKADVIQRQHEDWGRRIENMDRIKRMIPGPLKGFLRLLTGWRS